MRQRPRGGRNPFTGGSRRGLDCPLWEIPFDLDFQLWVVNGKFFPMVIRSPNMALSYCSDAPAEGVDMVPRCYVAWATSNYNRLRYADHVWRGRKHTVSSYRPRMCIVLMSSKGLKQSCTLKQKHALPLGRKIYPGVHFQTSTLISTVIPKRCLSEEERRKYHTSFDECWMLVDKCLLSIKWRLLEEIQRSMTYSTVGGTTVSNRDRNFWLSLTEFDSHRTATKLEKQRVLVYKFSRAQR